MIGFVTGLTAEARLLSGIHVLVGTAGGTPEGVPSVVADLLDQGATALISFGLAGGLSPHCRPGDLIVPAHVVDGDEIFSCDDDLVERLGGVTVRYLTGSDAIVSTRADKARLYAASGADAVDLESVNVARSAHRRGIAFAVLRAVVDPAEMSLPGASLAALDETGRISLARVVRSLIGNPLQVPDLVALGWGAAKARRALRREVTRRFRA